MADAEMVPDFILAPYFIGPQEIWAPKFGPRIKMLFIDFPAGTQCFSGTKLFGDQKSRKKKQATENTVKLHLR